MAFLGMNRSQAKSLGRLNNAIGSKIMQIWLPGLGAVAGAAVDTAIGSVPDNRPISQYNLMMGPGDPFAGYRQTEVGPDYTKTESIVEQNGYKGMDMVADALVGSNIMNMFKKKKDPLTDAEIEPIDTNLDGTKNNVQGIGNGINPNAMNPNRYSLGNTKDPKSSLWNKNFKF